VHEAHRLRRGAPRVRREAPAGLRAMTFQRPEATLSALTALARDVGEEHAQRIERLDETAADKGALAALAAAGLPAWTVPARDGGADAEHLAAEEEVSVRALCAVRDELAWHSGMLDVVFVLQG